MQPVLNFPPSLLLRAQGADIGMKAAVFDVDGVLTDGRLLIGEGGEALKPFSTLDGYGIRLLRRAGITPMIVTGRDSAALRYRVGELGVRHAAYAVEDKLAVTQSLLATLGIGWGDVAAIGDDWPDLPVLSRAALACAPAQAHPEVLARVHHVTAAPAGHGAAREFCDLLLVAAGHYGRLLDEVLQASVVEPGRRFDAGLEPPGGTGPGAAVHGGVR
jgi:3-deoxy-D-manno-octulosonate 8-phosphate phosphatase (KDO 8-P phosphatase)